MISAVEGCYDIEGGPNAWLSRVTERFLPLLDHGNGAQTMVLRRVRYGVLEEVQSAYLAHEAVREFTRRRFEDMPPALAEQYFRTVPPVDIAREFMAKVGMAPEAYEAQSPPGYRFRDHVTLVARDGSNEGLGITAFADRPIEISPGLRRMLRRLTWHLASGWRLLRLPLAVTEEAVLDPDGRCVHAEGDARDTGARDRLRDAVRAVDRARSRRCRGDAEEALNLWKGLVSGRWSLVDRFESDGKRYVVAHRNDPRYDDPRKLTAREQQCGRLAAAGYSGAEIAYALDMSASTVRSHINSAMRKLGLKRREELTEALAPAALVHARITPVGGEDARLVVASSPSDPPESALLALTAAEKAVARALLGGASYREIARARDTSERTVANQVQSIYTKLAVSSRAELAAKLRAGAAAATPDAGAEPHSREKDRPRDSR